MTVINRRITCYLCGMKANEENLITEDKGTCDVVPIYLCDFCCDRYDRITGGPLRERINEQH